MINQIDLAEKGWENVVWSITNLCRGKPVVKLDYVKEFAPFLSKAIIISQKEDYVTDALWAYSYLTDCHSPENLLSENLLSKCISFFTHPNLSILIPALRIVGNYSTGTIAPKYLANSELFCNLLHLIEHIKRPVRREAYWALSNLLTENHMIVQYGIDSLFFEKAINTLKNDESNVIKEAVFAVCNASYACTKEQAEYFEYIGIFDVLISLLSQSEKVSQVILEGIKQFLA